MLNNTGIIYSSSIRYVPEFFAFLVRISIRESDILLFSLLLSRFSYIISFRAFVRDPGLR